VEGVAVYYPFFLTYMLVGVVLSLAVFVWALKTGQFGDQKRARYLALTAELKPVDNKASLFARLEIYALWGVAFTGILLTGAVLIFAMIV
jgi:cbb3-type cytochrome oxidase maturation protein